MKNTNTGKIDVEKLDKVAGGEEAMIILFLYLYTSRARS